MKDFNLKIDSNLNKEKVFLYHPPAELVLDSTENEQLLRMPIPYEIEDIHLTKHIGNTSTYAQKNELIQLLKLIQYRLSNGFKKQLGNLSDNEKQIILEKLKEGVLACTPGFHNRVQEIILSWSRPKNILHSFIRPVNR